METGALEYSSPSDLICIHYKCVICIKLKRGLAQVPELAHNNICEVLYPHEDINLHNTLDVVCFYRYGNRGIFSKLVFLMFLMPGPIPSSASFLN